MDREQIRARQTTIEAHVYSTSGKQGLWDALEHNAWMRNDIDDLLAAIDELEARLATAEKVIEAAWKVKLCVMTSTEVYDHTFCIGDGQTFVNDIRALRGTLDAYGRLCETVRAVEHE